MGTSLWLQLIPGVLVLQSWVLVSVQPSVLSCNARILSCNPQIIMERLVSIAVNEFLFTDNSAQATRVVNSCKQLQWVPHVLTLASRAEHAKRSLSCIASVMSNSKWTGTACLKCRDQLRLAVVSAQFHLAWIFCFSLVGTVLFLCLWGFDFA